MGTIREGMRDRARRFARSGRSSVSGASVGAAVRRLVTLSALPAIFAASAASAQERLTLEDAVARAAAAAAPVEVAALRVEGAEARARQARSALLPSLTASAGVLNRSFNRQSLGIEFPVLPGSPPPADRVGPFDNYDARLRVQQTLFDYAGWARLRAAQAQIGVGDAERVAAADAAAHRAAVAYLQAVRADALTSAREADVALADSLVALAEAQVEAGVGVAIDVTRARTQRVTAEGLRLVARNRLEQAWLELARAIGAEPGARFALAETLEEELVASDVPVEPESAVALALRRRAELAVEGARGESAEAAAKAIRAERLPRLDVLADWGGNGLTAQDAIATHQVGVQLSLPIMDGLRREARLAEQDAALRASRVAERDLRRQIEAEVRAALLELESGLEQRRIAAERLALAEAELAQAVERFESGVVGNIEVINAQASLIRARDADIDARFAIAVARASLARAAGVAASVR